jgi:hypothetical protein
VGLKVFSLKGREVCEQKKKSAFENDKSFEIFFENFEVQAMS